MSAARPTGPRYWIALVVTGLLGGLLSGLFGVGGGIVMVPLLIALAQMDQRRAATTSLAAIVPTSIVGASPTPPTATSTSSPAGSSRSAPSWAR